MATEIGTATGFLDFYQKLRDFLTTNAALVAASQQWVVVSGPATGALAFTDQLVLKGPGLSSADEIYVTLEPSVSVAGDYYNLGIGGLSSWNPGAPISGQANRLTPRYIHLWNASTPYWFVANGRRFITIARVTTVYQSAYAGFILPYHLPTTWDYPLFIGACSSNATWRYSVVNDASHSAFFNPGDVNSDISSAASEGRATAAIRMPDGQWVGIANKNGGSEQAANSNNIVQWSYVMSNPSLRAGLDGDYTPIPAEIAIVYPFPANLGVLEGVYHVPGFGTASENTFTIGALSHLIVQNVYRTSNHEYAAIALEA